VVPAGSIATAPSAPTGLAATVGSGTVTLTWNAGGGATSYTVKRANVSGGTYTNLGTPTAATYADSGLTNGMTYYYVVSATNSAGTSGNSSEVAATPILPPTFTSSASASPNPVTQGTSTTITATITDTANALANGTVQISAVDPGGNTVASQSFTGQSFSASQTHNYTLSFTPAASGTFSVQLGVFSATGQQWSENNSAGSILVNSSLTFTSAATATPPSVVRGSGTSIQATVTDTGTASLTNANIEVQVFDSGGNAVSTNVWSGQNFTGGQTQHYTYTWSVPASQATGAYTVMIGVFDAGWTTNYYWNSNGAAIAVTLAQSAPPTPTGLIAIAGDSQVTLRWTGSTGASSYNLYRGTAAGAENATPVAGGIAATTYPNTGLTDGTMYFFKVAAVNAGGTSPMSNEAWAKPAPAVAIGICNVNQNTTVNVSDVQTMVNEVSGMSTKANDLNNDGVVNAVDIQIVINAALGLGCSGG
jgi:titin